MTALDGASREAADWRGNVWAQETFVGGLPTRLAPGGGPGMEPVVVPGASWFRLQTVPGGVWSVARSVAATTQGVYSSGRSVAGPLKGREVTRVVLSDSTYWAAAARGPLYFSLDGKSWSLAYQG
jgi:hypothetical protein